MPSKSARRSGWKTIQSKNKKNKRTKLALWILGLIIGLLVLSWIVRFTQSLFTPWQLSANSDSVFHTKKYIWNGEFNINLILRTNSEISLVSYSPKQEKVIIVKIPDEIFLEVPFGFGKWQVRAVYDLGQSQKNLNGDKLLTESLRNFFAIPIDGFLDLSTLKNQQTSFEIIDTMRKNPFSGIGFLSALKTDLAPLEFMKFELSLRNVRYDKVEQLDLNKLNILDQDRLPDGSVVLIGDPNKIDSVLSDLADPTIIAEHKTIAVFNATDEPQLAQKWARLISNMGGNVIMTANANKQLKNTQVIGDNSQTLKRLKQIFELGCQNSPNCSKKNLPSSKEEGKINPSDEDLVSSRAQINLFLGEDIK